MYPDTDPRSWHYIRRYNRPHISLLGAFGRTALAFCSCAAVYCALTRIAFCDIRFSAFVALTLLLLIVAVKSQGVAIWCIHCYQHYAPIRIRSMCRFEPSCSDYMILAIRKYGTVNGTIKGINRIKRCSSKDGGFDYP